ncbi:MAG: N-carbamoylputrescine amidase [Alphaproteobacteria bacterium]|nr:N-carbamoylputrescine amidase [Alphaproteobacteria bacterium]MCB9974430.1 N-carbamoylputrescine amidase [Rhodospirillales bacterium]
MSRITTVAAVQTRFSADMEDNIAKAASFIIEAADLGAQIVLLPELFQGLYFCTHQDEKWYSSAYPAETHPCVTELRKVAKDKGVVLPVSIFEKAGPEYYNSVVMVDDAGEIMGVYRKTHIPDGPGYQEKYYFKPGNTGFKVWSTRFGNIGVGICWDQWFPEAARAMTLKGADFLFYPTAIGSEPYDDTLDTSAIWQRAMQGHAVANAIPVIAANRIGTENANGQDQSFYGSSFIAGQNGELMQSFGHDEEGVIAQGFDLDAMHKYRAVWGFFRDRRPEMYGEVTRLFDDSV